ncbi:FMN-binding protein [Lutibacter sp. Hel_I_33_5]|uniref:FMN-binding protein n=1 Tax=Lutibacter sp. Hel_I_33_5 TaxID=1566289 RepID=UPI0011A98BEB|nr:FMN-binding protein [Lutibacter sp. Hel_I_33_5]TVZ55101.1 FMN-binding protein [Lutibacter sp. Hel_I_33_5]
MILKRFFSFLLVLTSLVFLSFSLPSKIEKKVKKEIKKTFIVENFTIETISIEDSVNLKLSKKINNHNLYKIVSSDVLIGYAFIDKAPSKTDEFDYLILLDTNLIIKKSKVLKYREDYGGEIGSRRWLKQFIGKKSNDTLQYGNDIMAISGATISANSMTIAVNSFLQNLRILIDNKVFDAS